MDDYCTASRERLQKVIDLGQQVTEIKDIDLMLETVLTKARQFVNADAGSIYVKDGDVLRFKYTQNETQQAKLPPGKKLIYSTFSVPISEKTISGYVALTGTMLNIPDVYELTGGTPYSFGRDYDRLSNYRTTSMLTFPLKTHRGDTVGVLQLINARDDAGAVVAFAQSDESLLLNFANMAANAIEHAEMTRAIIMRMIKMAELRDPKETGAHVNRVASYSVEIYEAWARRRGMDADRIEKDKDVLRMAAMLHDVGKVAISDSILKKPGRLDPEEYSVMKQHTVLGARLFADLYSDFDDASCVVALNHHERWDGNGYPGHVDPVTCEPLPGCAKEDGTARGKAGEEIHPFGRVVAIADVYDALSSRRSYKAAWDESQVLDELRKEAGRQFDPEMIEAFFSCLDSIQAATARYPHE